MWDRTVCFLSQSNAWKCSSLGFQVISGHKVTQQELTWNEKSSRFFLELPPSEKIFPRSPCEPITVRTRNPINLELPIFRLLHSWRQNFSCLLFLYTQGLTDTWRNIVNISWINNEIKCIVCRVNNYLISSHNFEVGYIVLFDRWRT